MIAVQEIVMQVQPDLIIETGIAHGGSLVYSASLLELLSLHDSEEQNREVIGIDIELRDHNRKALVEHPLYRRMNILDGSSIDEEIVRKVQDIAKKYHTIMVFLDSNHTHAHVLEELKLYTPLVSCGSYCVVFDTAVEFAEDDFSNRPWGKGNNPYTAVQEFLKTHPEFVVDQDIEDKIVLTSCPGGWLRKV